jgi:hypothetical protein
MFKLICGIVSTRGSEGTGGGEERQQKLNLTSAQETKNM